MSNISTNGFMVVDGVTVDLENIQINRGQIVTDVPSNGIVSNPTGSILQVNPSMTATCIRPSSCLLGLISPLGTAMSTKNVDLYLQATTNEGVRGTDHEKYHMVKGMIYPTTLTARQGDIAKLGLAILPISNDGDSVPYTYADDAALPSITAGQEVDTLGAVVLNTQTLVYVNDYTINFNTQCTAVNSDGKKYPLYVTTVNHNPTITIGLKNTMQASSLIGYDGVKIDGDNPLTLSLYGTSNKIVSTSPSITFTVRQGLVTLTSIPAQQGSLNTAQLEVKCHYDLTNYPITSA